MPADYRWERMREGVQFAAWGRRSSRAERAVQQWHGLRAGMRLRAAPTMMLVALAIAGCGGSSKPTVCHVYPGVQGQPSTGLVYSPAGCQKNLKHETLDIESSPEP